MQTSNAELGQNLKEWARKVDLLLEQASKRVENERRRAAILEAQNNLYRAQASKASAVGVTKRAEAEDHTAAPTSEASVAPARDSDIAAIAAVAPKALDVAKLAMMKEAARGLDIAYLRRLEEKGGSTSSAAVPCSSHAAQGLDEPGSSLASHVPLHEATQAAIRETAQALDLAYMRKVSSPRRSRSSVQADVVTQSQLAAGAQQSVPSTAEPRSLQDTSDEAFRASFTAALQGAVASGSNEAVGTLLESHSKELEQRVYRHNLQAQLLQRHASQRLNALDVSGHSVLSTLLQRPDAEEKLVVMLLQAKADPLQKEVGGSTAFHACAEAGHVNVLRLLTSYTNGESLRVYDAQGRTALHQAAAAGHAEAVQVLLQMKADAAACDLALRAPVDLAQDAKVLQLLRPPEEMATSGAEPEPSDGTSVHQPQAAEEL